MNAKIAIAAPTNETKHKPEHCADCGKELPRRDGHLSYWCRTISHPTEPGWILTVKICHECRRKEEA